MLKIRLQRVGRKHEPVFRLVVIDSHEGPKSGKAVEVLGNYDSRRGEKAEFKSERIKHWMALGAQTSGTVHNLLVSKNIIEGKKINVLPKKKPIKKEGESSETVTPKDSAEAKPAEQATGEQQEAPTQEIATEPVSKPAAADVEEPKKETEQAEQSTETAEKPAS